MVEVKRDFDNSLRTSEFAKDWTEMAKESQFSKIITIMDNPGIASIPEVEELKELASKREYRELQKKVGVPIKQCDGRLGRASLAHFGNYINRLKAAYKVSVRFGEEFVRLQHDMGILENATDAMRIQQSEERYLATHETMTDEEYRKLFGGRNKLQQGQLGDCYLVSGINELARAQHFDTLMRTSIQRVHWNDGSGSGYQIKIPLGVPSGRRILLKDDELSIAKIRGADGYKLLELAYAKNRRKNDKQGNRYAPITEDELKKIEGGWTHEVLMTFLGKQNIGYCDFGTMKFYPEGKLLSSAPPQTKREILNFLGNYYSKIGNRFISLASLKGDSDQMTYEVGGKTIFFKHAYLLTGVKKNEFGDVALLRVLNPYNGEGNGRKYQDYTPEEFFNSFSAIAGLKINTKNFLGQEGIA